MSRTWYSNNPTPREVDVLKLVAAGLENKEVAKLLWIQTGTVKSHIQNMMRRTGCTKRTELIVYGLKAGWLSLDDITLLNKAPVYNRHNEQTNLLPDECHAE